MAEPTLTDLCNLALSIVGGAIQATHPWIDDYDADPGDGKSNPTLKWCQLLAPRAIRRVQRAYKWNRLVRFPEPGNALDTASALTSPGYTYMYTRPVGCLRFCGVVANAVNAQTGELTYFPFLEVGGQIACNNTSTDILFECVMESLLPSEWGEPLLTATAHWLACLLARPMGVDAAGRAAIFKLWNTAFVDSINDDGMEGFKYRKSDPLRRTRLPSMDMREGQLYIRRL